MAALGIDEVQEMGGTKNLKTCVVFSVFWLATVSIASGRTIYVDDDAPPGGNGSSWTNAYDYLQDALTDANSAPKPVEIHVAQGIYKPDLIPPPPPPMGLDNSQDATVMALDRKATFQLQNGVVIKGGYAGLGEIDPNVRDIDKYETILSGDLAGNDENVLDPEDLFYDPSRSENSYHIVIGSGTEPNAVLDGVTITGGRADGSTQGYLDENDYGGGMLNIAGSPTILNCTFSGNTTRMYGGGVQNDNGNPTFTNCTFIANSATDGGGVNSDYGDPVLTGCTFTSNRACSYNADGGFGGGMFNFYSNSVIQNCIFSGNATDEWGSGGGIRNKHSSVIITNCTFTNNHPLAILNRYGSLKMTNCILWGDIPYEMASDGIEITYSDIEGGWAGEGNIDVDPCFVEPGYWDSNGLWVEGDYHLKSRAWRWLSQHKTWTQDNATSMCIDAGNPGSSLEQELLSVPPDPNNERGQNLRINMGAYGRTAQAAMPPNGWAILADLTNDGIVDFNDLAKWVQMWPTSGSNKPGDLDRNGIVDMADFALLAMDWRKEKSYLPSPANNPNPPDGASISNLDFDVSWTTGARATSHDIYFGTTNPPPFIRNQTDTTFDPGIMVVCTKYYWRIDEVNLSGTTTGTTWSFMTMLLPPPPPLPGKASNPIPADGTKDVSTLADLSWTAGTFGWSHDVYFGTTSPPPFVCNQASTTFDTGTMDYNTTHYWRIDEVNPTGTATGSIWHFTTEPPPPPPSQASNPNPADGATGVNRTADLIWTAGTFASSHDVYFGTSSPPQFVCNQTSTIFDTGKMASSRWYYWRIDEVNPSGTTTGNIWSFKTELTPPPPPP